MIKFKKGQRVKVLGSGIEKELRGRTGVVVDVQPSPFGMVLVYFANWSKGHDGLAEANIQEFGNHHWYFLKTDLKVVPTRRKRAHRA